MTPTPFDQDVTERRREQNRLAQRRFRQRHRQAAAPQSRRRTSMSNSSADFQFDNILAPTPAPTQSTEGGAAASASIYDWELPQLSETVTTDGTIVGDESELTSQSIIDTWLSQPGAIEYIPDRSPLAIQAESHNPVGTMTINAPSASAGASSDCTTPLATPLHTAAKRGHTKIVRLLLEHKAKCDIRDHDGLTPLIHATMAGHEEVVGLLLSHGASVELTDQQNRSALHWAVINRYDRLLKVLLGACTEDKSIIDGITSDGRTPLHIAVETDFEAAVELLLESGADGQYKMGSHE